MAVILVLWCTSVSIFSTVSAGDMSALQGKSNQLNGQNVCDGMPGGGTLKTGLLETISLLLSIARRIVLCLV